MIAELEPESKSSAQQCLNCGTENPESWLGNADKIVCGRCIDSATSDKDFRERLIATLVELKARAPAPREHNTLKHHE
jgi:hypothetical protein